ncbi:alpha/beta hydrolase [Corallococcus terminator]|uniref:Alpha/beta hydrolase n=2 Tax=Corallococcus terminator TaxID=2316733 RepID=A0A3A8J3V0_9BACT|nr:alpha/beta hydrolase [Corallococcus terminator]
MQVVLDAHKALKPVPPHTVSPRQARTGVTAKDAVEKTLKDQGKPVTPEKVAKVEDRKLKGAKGEIPVRVYTPDGAGPFPVVVYYHGGGFVLADLDTYDASARALANQAKAVVVSVEYRHAPEHPFPAAADDATAAFQYVQKNAKEFNGDASKVAVAGESAGANLATVVAMRQKQDGGAQPVFQLLVYPFVSNNVNTPSHQANGQGNYLIGNQDIAWFWGNYLGKDWVQNKDPNALPLKATPAQLRGLPPAMVVTASLDPLKDEGQEYAKNLKAAGVKVDVKNYDGVTHEFFGMAPVLDIAKKAQADAGMALRKAFSEAPRAQQGMGGSGMTEPVKE